MVLGAYAPGQSQPSGETDQTPVYKLSLYAVVGGVGIHIKDRSLHINNVAGQVEVCEFIAEDQHGAFDIQVHQSLVIVEDMVTTFYGDVDEAELVTLESPYDVNIYGAHTGSPVGAREWHIKGTGLSNFAKRYLTGVFSAQAKVPLQLVIQVVASNVGLASDINLLPPGMILPDAFLSDHEPLSDTLDRLTNLASSISGTLHLWQIGWGAAGMGGGGSFDTIRLKVFAVGTDVSSYSVGGSLKIKANSIRVRTSRQQFANRVILKLDKYLKERTTQSFTFEDVFLGTLKLSGPLAGAPLIEVGGQPTQTVGIKDIDTGKDWYWNTGSSVLTVGGSAGGGSDTIDVTYDPIDTRVIAAENAGSIATVGLFATMVLMGDSSNAASPAGYVLAMLKRRDQLTKVVTLEVRCPPNVFHVGQVAGLLLTSYGVTGVASLSGTFYLRSVDHVDDSQVIWRRLELVQGPMLYSGAQVMGRLGR